MKNEFSDFTDLDAMKNHPVSAQIDEVFKSVIKGERIVSAKKETMAEASSEAPVNELDLDEMEIDIDLSSDTPPAPEASTLDEGMELSFSDDEGLDLGSVDTNTNAPVDAEQFGDLSLDDGPDFSLTDSINDPVEDLGSVGLTDSNLGSEIDLEADDGFSLSDSDYDAGEKTTVAGLSLSEDFSSTNLKLSDDDLSLSDDDDDLSLSFADDERPALPSEADLSDDAKKKLKEIDAIMDFDASQVGLTRHNLQLHLEKENLAESSAENLDEPLVSEDLDLDSIDFGNEQTTIAAKSVEAPKKKKKESAPVAPSGNTHVPNLGRDLSEISGAYSGEMERMQATISNLRSDREELLIKIQKLEDDKVMQARQSLTMRAELDEKKIELTIIRKKLNDEINELKDRLKLFDEKKLIFEEKNRILLQELDKANQKNKIDVKKVQLRERELEQKLELLKSDAESQIRHRDMKILELKRKIDAMEFDMESISMQEKRSVESRFELEDKLEKAIKTLRGAITVLEDESDRGSVLEALKKNIDM